MPRSRGIDTATYRSSDMKMTSLTTTTITTYAYEWLLQNGESQGCVRTDVYAKLEPRATCS
jgi:hypothetical protein